MMDRNRLTKAAHWLHSKRRAFAEDFDIEAVLEREEQMRKGLSAEDELSVTVMWLGNCAAIHRLGQERLPLQAPYDEMRPPDFLAFPIVKGKPTPVLIEVKSANSNTIPWSEKYLRGLRAFAELMNLPLLIAWRNRGIWSLTDHRHIEKNITGYRLGMETAFKQDLMSVIFGDVRVSLNADVELILDMEIKNEVSGDKDDLLPEGEFEMKITNAGYYVKGEKIREGDFSTDFFMAAPGDGEIRRTAKQRCQQVFRTMPDHIFPLSRVFAAQLSLGMGEEGLQWHQFIDMETFPSKGVDVRDSLKLGLENGFIRYVFEVVPHTWPDFVPH